MVYCGQAASSCKKSKGCSEKKGKCYGPMDEIPAGAENLGNCKGRCKCYKEGTNVTAGPPQTCGEKRKCQERGGVCLKEAPDNYEFAGFFCKRRTKCKCFLPPTTEASVRKFAYKKFPNLIPMILRIHCLHSEWSGHRSPLSVSIQV